MLTLSEPLWSDYVKFAKAHVASGDIDPLYPVLKELYRRQGLTPDQAYWQTFLYVAYYNLKSAWALREYWPEPYDLMMKSSGTLLHHLSLPTGVERRGFRGQPNRILRHFESLFSQMGRASMEEWVVRSTLVADPKGDWQNARRSYQRIKYGGPWSSFKWADLLKNVHGLPIEAPDIGVGSGQSGTAGPIQGMVRLTGLDERSCAGDVEVQWELLKRAQDAGVPLLGLDQLETTLCDFNSLVNGRYYVGKDIDELQQTVQGMPQVFWDVRRAVFPERYLGELNGWMGIRKSLCKHYKLTGEVLT